jgi:hypothetical protein
MFCPNCGVHQPEGKKFCTNCGTNLLVVSQALQGPPPSASIPPAREAERQRQMATGLKMTIIGGAFVAIQFFNFIFSLPFRRGGSAFGFWTFVAVVVAVIGISKIMSARPAPEAAALPRPGAAPPAQPLGAPPRPVFSASPPLSAPPPPTSAFEPASRVPSATEEETQHLPEYAPPREVPK